jgi:hypothetical protein
MAQLDITETNRAVERLLEVTENPRHRYLLEAYNRHRYLESAGRYEEIFAPEMTVEHPLYRFTLIGQPRFKLEGREQVEALYRHWTETDQCVFYTEDNETVAVGDHMIVSRVTGYQQTLGSALVEAGVEADADAMYLTQSQIAMLWPYDERGRLIGEDVWEYDDAERDVIKLDPADVLTAEQAGKLLAPLIKPLPSFDDRLHAAGAAPTSASASASVAVGG